MSETESAAELERVAQAIALSEGFQLLVLECEGLPPGGLQRLLDEVQRQVAELRGVPPLFVIYDPRWATDWLLESMAELPRPTETGASIVAVIDGTDTSLSQARARRDDDWHFLFQRINERRNAIGRSLGGTMLLALSPARYRMFLEEAPDMASIRSGMFRIGADALRANFQPALAPVALKAWYSPAILREVALRRVTTSPRAAFMERSRHAGTVGATHRLWELLVTMFRPRELRRFVHYHYPEVAGSLPENAMAYQELAIEIVEALRQRGLINRGFFDRLVAERAGHRDEIDDAAGDWGYSLRRQAEGQTTFSVPSDLHDALLQLDASQREQVMYLAGFAGGDVSPTVMRGIRERPPISAREIFGRARAGGPEGLARLAQAIEIVTGSE